MPTPLKPVEQKRRLGNPGGEKLPEAEFELNRVDPATEPWRPLAPAGRALWESTLSTTPWLARSDLEMVLLMCETLDERQAMRLTVLQGNAGWRDRVALRNVDRQIIDLLNFIGGSPAQRTRLALGEVQLQKGIRSMVHEQQVSAVKDIVVEAIAVDVAATG